MLKSLKDHIDHYIDKPNTPGSNAYVYHPDFDSLYIRVSKRILGNSLSFVKTIDIANITANEPGSGCFKKLVQYLLDEYKVTVFVENALTPRFQKGLVRMGFTPSHTPMCYYKGN